MDDVHYYPDKNQPFLNSTGNGNQIPKGRQSFVNKFSNFGSTIVTIYTFQSKRPRRTRVVPICDHHHQRPSSSMAGRCKSRTPSHFFKIILPSTIQQMKLVSNVSCYTIFQWLTCLILNIFTCSCMHVSSCFLFISNPFLPNLVYLIIMFIEKNFI